MLAVLLASGWLAATAPYPSIGREAPARQYRAVRAVDEIVVDGRATEKTWQVAPIDDRFVERQPVLGATPPVRTTLQVAYDDQALYVFIDAESEPGDVVVRTLRRDNEGIFADDAVYVKVDPSHNRREAYSLGVNADGAQLDGIGLNDGGQFLREWDGVWTAETVRREDGYTAEFRIPFAVLGMKSSATQVIGFDISRDHPRRNATYDWRVFIPPRSPLAASQFGEVTGLRDIHAQRAVEFTPYVLARTNFEPRLTLDPAARPNIATGGDIRMQIGTGSYAEASLLTDFAQVEADEVQVARNRFPLFFPERRPFFINGLDVFNFGRPQEAQLFFSRRVGLAAGTPVAIASGAKVYGRTGPVSYGVLQVQTLGSPDDPRRGLRRSVPENVTIARTRIQASRALNVGGIVIGQHRFGRANPDHASVGADAQLIGLDGRLQGYGFLAATWGEHATGGVDDGGPPTPPADIGSSGSAALAYRGLFVRPSLLWLWSDDDFDPRLGFYRRPGTSRQSASVEFAPRPQILGLREIVFGAFYSLEADSRYSARIGQEGGAWASLNWKNGSSLGYNVAHFVDTVQDPFDLYLHSIAPDHYLGFRHSVSARSPSRRAVGGFARYEFVELFGGRAHQPTLSITARLGKHFTASATYTHLIGQFDASRRFNFGFANANVDLAITRNLAFDNLLRLDLSPANERIGLQSRLRWRFLPGSDLFVVYRTDQPLDLGAAVSGRQQFHELTVKVSYYLRVFLRRKG